MRKYILFLMACLALAACKDSNDEPTPGGEAGPKYRVTEIKGRNGHWGEYTMKVAYHRSAIDSIVVYNPTGDRISTLKPSQSGSIYYLKFNDIIPGIDPDKIAELIEEHGEEGAKEHIPMVSRTLFEVRSEIKKGALTGQTFIYYRPRGDVGTGSNFNNNYLNDRRIRYLYEYDSKDRLVICRIFQDIYDEDRNSQYMRRIFKTEADISDGQTDGMQLFQSDERYESETNYILRDTYRFVYSGTNLTSVEGADLHLSYTYSGSNPSSVSNGVETRGFEYNTSGQLKKITFTGGDFVEVVKYEEGEGDIHLFTPLIESSFNIPLIN